MAVSTSRLCGDTEFHIGFGHPLAIDSSLYFDKDTGLLAKTERRAVDPMSGQEVNEERIVTEYQKLEGMQSPKRILVNRDGKKFMEAEIVEVKFLDKVDPQTFGKPN